MRRKLWFVICAMVAFAALPAVSVLAGPQKEAPRTGTLPPGVDPNAEVLPGIKRGDVLILEDPTGSLANPDSFNRWSCWAGGGGGWSTGIQQLALDTLWYIDPDAGIPRPGVTDQVWHNSLAAEKPIYNADTLR